MTGVRNGTSWSMGRPINADLNRAANIPPGMGGESWRLVSWAATRERRSRNIGAAPRGSVPTRVRRSRCNSFLSVTDDARIATEPADGFQGALTKGPLDLPVPETMTAVMVTAISARRRTAASTTQSSPCADAANCPRDTSSFAPVVRRWAGPPVAIRGAAHERAFAGRRAFLVTGEQLQEY